MISLSTPTPSPITAGLSAKSCPPSESGGYFSSQRNASSSRRRSNTLDWSSQKTMSLWIQQRRPSPLPLSSPSLPTSSCLQPHPPLLHSNSDAYLHNLYDYITPTLRLTADQYRTHLGLVPTPRAAVYIPFPHSSYLPDPFSLTIAGNYSFLV